MEVLWRHLWESVLQRSIPPHILQVGHYISRLELLNIMVAICYGINGFKGKDILIYCDNEASVSVLQTGRSSDNFMLQCAREIWYFAAI